ncbi:MAG: 23S rRNA (uridine(2552)-2'-O)-methyltransferase RlmE [Gammaproteobacteria bacterium]|jgi:23S rRNA (uridine2552-2'-O)-methyltransferase
MAKSSSSKQWLQEHFDDQWVKKARDAGYRSRASFKLLEIHQKDKLLKPGMIVVDLGCAPGGWAQIASRLVKPGGKVVASDILEMEPVDGVHFIQGDFTEEACFNQILETLEGKPVDLVISDMAPNLSGMNDIDQPKAMYLVDLAVDFAGRTLREGGVLLMKVFQGEGFNELLQRLRQEYGSVASRKPESSRARSREVYLLAKGKK